MELEQILQTESAALTRRLQRMIGSVEAAEDLRQDTMARALTSAPPAAGEDQLRAWLHRVAANLAVDELRRRARRRQLPLDEAPLAAVSLADGRVIADPFEPTADLVLLLRARRLQLREAGTGRRLGHARRRARAGG